VFLFDSGVGERAEADAPALKEHDADGVGGVFVDLEPF